MLNTNKKIKSLIYKGEILELVSKELPEKIPTLVSKTITENGTYRPNERKDGIIIEWNGSTTYEDGTDRPYVTDGEHYKFYKVSDRFFSLDELTNVTIEQTWNNGEVTVTEKKDGEEFGGYHYVMGLADNPALRSFGPNQNTVEEGTYLTLLTYEDGSYYYVNKVILPNAQGEVVDGYNEVVVNVQPPLQERTYTIDNNGTYEITVGPKLIEWDGEETEYFFDNVEGLNTGIWYLVYDQFLTQEELLGYKIISSSGEEFQGEVETLTGTSNGQNYIGYLLDQRILSVPISGSGEFEYNGVLRSATVPKAGVYFFKSTSVEQYPAALALPAQNDYQGLFKVSVKVDMPIGMPNEVTKASAFDTILTSSTQKIGSVYKYTGETTDIYEQGAIYVLEEVEE